MTVSTSDEGGVPVLAVSGTIDTRAAPEFEAALAKALGEAGTRAIVDFTRVDLITSAGIRVLVMFAKRLHRAGGGLALCCLTPEVQRVFEISGLTAQFTIATTRADAVKMVKPASAAAPPSRGSRVSRLVGALLGAGEPAPPASQPPGGKRSMISRQVARLLGDDTPDQRK
jgi:anti-anti-sigma factor